jgi:predicted Fe-Mo cluster-binding NifX family protein
MKIAVVTDDGQTVSAHFGRARAYAVLTVHDGVVVGRELRAKSSPHTEQPAGDDDADKSHDGPAAHARHDRMIEPISDCAYVVARGMGRGAYERITASGIQAVVTDLVDPEAAALACADGRIENRVDRLH